MRKVVSNTTPLISLGILLRAKQHGLISDVKPLMESLIAKGVWISKQVFDDMLTLAGE